MNPFRGWEIGPEILYDMGIRMRDEYGNLDWFVAESGMGVENKQRYRDVSGTIQDDYRIDFIKPHLANAVGAARRKIKKIVRGFSRSFFLRVDVKDSRGGACIRWG